MDGWRRVPRIVLSLLCLSFAGCHSRQASEEPASVAETIDAVARRVSSRLSLRTLNHIATHGDALLGALTSEERRRLGQDYLRVLVKRPMVVHVAAPSQSVPFWINDQGFEPTAIRLKNADAEWSTYRKLVQAGWIGLGVNGLDRTPPTHYMVFLKSVEKSGDVQASVELRSTDREDWKLATVDTTRRVSPDFDVYHPFESIPSELQGAIAVQGSHERRHATLLAPARIWKTHVASSRIPDQITISFGADAGREIVWSWRTRPDVEQTRLRLAVAKPGKSPADADPEPSASSEWKIVEGESKLVETPCVLNDRAIRRHRVAVRDLEPGRSYLYSIADDTPGGWGPWTPIRTAPGRRSHTQFLYLGDPQTGFESWGKRFEAAYRRFPKASFVLIAGDLVDRGNERTNWDHFFLRSEAVFNRLPIMPSSGNHEYLDQGPQLFKMFFDLPRNGPKSSEADLVYSFEHGDAFFAVLDSTMAVSSTQAARAQADWLDRALSTTTATWKFVTYHHPVYASRRKRDNQPLKDHWVPIFDKHHVDIVFQGHDHTYIRTHPMRANRRASSAEEGTFYVVSVSGDKLYDQEPRSEFEVARSFVPTCQVIDIDPETRRLTYRSLAENGETIDSFVIDKPVETTGRLQFARGR